MSKTTAPVAPLTALSAIAGDQPAETAAAPGVAPDASTSQPADSTTTTEPAADEAPAVKLPGKDATPEQWSEFYKQIGAPDKAEAYELPLPEGDSGEFAKTRWRPDGTSSPWLNRKPMRYLSRLAYRRWT